MSDNSVQDDREQLALAFRLAERFGFHEGICNHFSVRVEGPDEHYLINPYGIHWSRIQADSLLLIDSEGTVLEGTGEVEDTARFIHVAGHQANARHKAILHTHMPYATTLTMLQGDSDLLPMAHQTAIRFHERMEVEPDFGGLALDAEEGARISERAAGSPDVDIFFLANHGVVVGGESVAAAFDDLYYLERACRQHVFALQTGQPLKHIPDSIVQLTARQTNRDRIHFATSHFNALADVLSENPNHRFTF